MNWSYYARCPVSNSPCLYPILGLQYLDRHCMSPISPLKPSSVVQLFLSNTLLTSIRQLLSNLLLASGQLLLSNLLLASGQLLLSNTLLTSVRLLLLASGQLLLSNLLLASGRQDRLFLSNPLAIIQSFLSNSGHSGQQDLSNMLTSGDKQGLLFLLTSVPFLFSHTLLTRVQQDL